MANSTETTTRLSRGRRLLLAGVTGAVLVGGGAGLAYAGQQDSPPTSTSGYGTVVDERGAPLQPWPDRTNSGSGATTEGSGEDCPGEDGGSSGGGSTSPSQPTSPTTPDGDQL